MAGFYDIHHHILYGIDADGPKSFEDMRLMLHAAVEDGISTIIATPHVTPGVRYFDWEFYHERLQEANAYCSRNGLPLKVYGGAELLWTAQTPELLVKGVVPSMLGTRFALVEFSPQESREKIETAIKSLNEAGYIPILAHTERYQNMIRLLRFVDKLKREYKVYYQVNCRTIIHGGGFFQRRFLRHILHNNLLDAISTDAHNVKSRKVNFTEAHDSLQSRGIKFYYNELALKIFKQSMRRQRVSHTY